MRDDTFADPDALDEGALLAAYLDAETDEVTTARLERRLADDAALAARLDALAATRARLQRLSQVAAPVEPRQRLREQLAAERARGQRTVAPARAAGSRRWALRTGPLATAAAVVLVAVIGLATVISQQGGVGEGAMGADESGEEAAQAAGDAGGAARAGGDSAGGSAENGAEAGAAVEAPAAAEEAQADSGAQAAPGSDTGGAPSRGAAKVDGDEQIAARAQRLRADPPASLRARERRLRDRAGLPMDRLCVREFDAATVDLIDEDGRVAFAVLVKGASPQIVLLDPRTCMAIRTISAQR